MIKVTIEADGEEKKILTGEMLNMAVLGEDGCKIAMVSQPTKRGISSNNFIQSLQKLVQCSIKSFAQGDKTMESILKVCFAEAMIERPDGMKDIKEEEQGRKKDVEHRGLDVLFEILRKVVED